MGTINSNMKTLKKLNKDQDEGKIRNNMRVSLFQLKKHHSLFLKLGIETCKEMISHMPLIILDDTQLLYKEGEYVNSAYIVILGKIIMHTTKLGVIGLITIGEFVGEE